VKRVLVISLILFAGIGLVANPFQETEGWKMMTNDASAVVSQFGVVQTEIASAITGILPMLIGIFGIFLIIRFVPKLVKRFTR
jgi:hypothetical protein